MLVDIFERGDGYDVFPASQSRIDEALKKEGIDVAHIPAWGSDEFLFAHVAMTNEDWEFFEEFDGEGITKRIQPSVFFKLLHQTKLGQFKGYADATEYILERERMLGPWNR